MTLQSKTIQDIQEKATRTSGLSFENIREMSVDEIRLMFKNPTPKSNPCLMTTSNVLRFHTISHEEVEAGVSNALAIIDSLLDENRPRHQPRSIARLE